MNGAVRERYYERRQRGDPGSSPVCPWGVLWQNAYAKMQGGPKINFELEKGSLKSDD
jgi:hypothetical protein